LLRNVSATVLGQLQGARKFVINIVYVMRMGEDRGVHRVLVGKPEVKRPLGRPRRRWEDNMKMDFLEVGGGHGD
jgi:hypothetical protein